MQQPAPPLVVMAGAGRLDPERLCRLYADQVFRFAAMVSNGNSDAEDLALTIHPHPTLSETVGFAAELAQGTITDLVAPRPRR